MKTIATDKETQRKIFREIFDDEPMDQELIEAQKAFYKLVLELDEVDFDLRRKANDEDLGNA